jgi:hypothetical protein
VIDITGGLVTPPAGWQVTLDDGDDQFVLQPGFPAPANVQPYADLLAVGAFHFQATQDMADGLTETMGCLSGTFGIVVFCNSGDPIGAGEYTLVYTVWAAPPPDPFPDAAICSWGMQSNVDDDLTTGFPDPPLGHPLTGSEVYHEGLMFVGDEGLNHYLLATDYRQPERPDTGSFQGNLPTDARLLASLPTPRREYTDFVLISPVADFGDLVSAHGYCAEDRSDLSNTIAIDALGHPGQGQYPVYLPIIGAE